MGRSKNKVRTAIRKCATCGEPFTWTSRNPKKRFCDPVCKARWWRVSNSDTTNTMDTPPSTTASASTGHTASMDTVALSAGTARTVSTDTIVTASTANAVTHVYDPYVSGYADRQTPSTTQNCPNCHQPVAVINLLVAPAAAYVNTPSRSVTDQQQPQ
jgi:endogenous inhibitor of DNA gyrase (YacG/DUF329 family)